MIQAGLKFDVYFYIYLGVMIIIFISGFIVQVKIKPIK